MADPNPNNNLLPTEPEKGYSLSYLSDAKLKEQIITSLGGPTLCTEISDAQLNNLIAITRRWWIAYVGGVRKLLFKTYAGGQSILQLTPDVEDVTQVYFTVRLPLQFDFPELFETTIPWPGAFSTLLGGPSYTATMGNMPYSGLVQALQSIEMNKKILSADQDFDFDKRSKKLTIFPRAATGGFLVIDYLANNFCLDELAADEAEIFYRWARAEVMQTLGFIRSKFGSFPVPGGERTLNGDKLLEEARTEKEFLRKEVIDKFKPGYFFAE